MMKIKTIILEIVTDLLLLLGIVSLLYGIYSIYQPATYIVSGIILIIAFKPSFGAFNHNLHKTIRKKQ
jgi:hypothetical protein